MEVPEASWVGGQGGTCLLSVGNSGNFWNFKTLYQLRMYIMMSLGFESKRSSEKYLTVPPHWVPGKYWRYWTILWKTFNKKVSLVQFRYNWIMELILILLNHVNVYMANDANVRLNMKRNEKLHILQNLQVQFSFKIIMNSSFGLKSCALWLRNNSIFLFRQI